MFHLRSHRITQRILLISILGCLSGCGNQNNTTINTLYNKLCSIAHWPDEILRPYLTQEFTITAVQDNQCHLFHVHCATYTVQPKTSFTPASLWQSLPLPDAVEQGMGLKTRTLSGILDCIAPNSTLQTNIEQARINNTPGYYRFYQTDVLAFYLPNTQTLTIAMVEF